MGCPPEWVGDTAGVPQLAADLPQRARRQPWYRSGSRARRADFLATTVPHHSLAGRGRGGVGLDR
jgi:hypothetical protein